MRIGYDGKRAAKELTGFGKYSRWLIEQLSIKYPENEYLVYAPSVSKDPIIKKFFAVESIWLKQNANNAFLWQKFGIMKDLMRDGVKVYHGLSNELPFAIQHTKIKSIVTIHDLNFLRFPKNYPFVARTFLKLKTKAACLNANRIVAISEKIKQDIIQFYNINPEKIDVIYQSCDDAFKLPFSKERLLQLSSKYKLPEKYILNVGTIASRKNLITLVDALKSVEKTYNLVVVGKKTSYFKKVAAVLKQHNLQKRILFIENIDFQDLPGIYQKAALFVNPSIFEAFSMQMLQAMHAGIPVVAASGSGLEEVGGPESIYVDPKDSSALAIAINSVLENPAKTKEMATKGLNYVQKFDNELLAKQMIECYQKVLV